MFFIRVHYNLQKKEKNNRCSGKIQPKNSKNEPIEIIINLFWKNPKVFFSRYFPESRNRFTQRKYDFTKEHHFEQIKKHSFVVNKRKKYPILPKKYQKMPNGQMSYLLNDLFSTFVPVFTKFASWNSNRKT